MPDAVTITGTRSTGHQPPENYRALFERYVRPFGGDARFFVGGASGIDSLCLRWLASETDAELVVVVPARLGDQPADARHAVATVQEEGRLAELVELGGEARTDGYHARNRWMVDRSGLVIGFPRRGTTNSGTLYTLAYAADLDIPRLVVPV
ncbi:hypothetical protein [Actinomadura roseirufa]|uniref:hypothetical protein n=1 Tax=Actinomadura roseirufa TaxID=2094049 RepID=UPI00104118E3|nr:hypothetical protein [Actinomadura roseirufa]